MTVCLLTRGSSAIGRLADWAIGGLSLPLRGLLEEVFERYADEEMYESWDWGSC